jgi:hypothetical protein
MTPVPSPARSSADVRERWLWFLLAAVFVVASGLHLHKVMHNRSAINRWQAQILGLENGDNLAERYNYPNPPIMALLLWPIVKLPPVPAALLWFYVKAALTLISIVWVFRLVETPERPFPFWAKVLTILLSLKPILDDLSHGNVNLFILFLVVAALTAYRRQRDLLAGATLALAIACKVTPALFVPYFLWKRSWKVLSGVAFGLVLFLWPGVVPSLILGFKDNQALVVSWYQEMVHPFVVEGKVTPEHNNQSLPGLVSRLLTHSPSFSTYDDKGNYVPLEYHNIVDVGPAAARWLLKGCMGLFALLIVWTCRTPTRPRQGWRLAAEFALVTLGMLLFSERTWKHHCVTMLLPFAVLSYHLATESARAGMRAYVAASLATAAALMLAATTGQSGVADSHGAYLFGKLAQVYGVYVGAYLVLIAALATSLRQGDRCLASAVEPLGAAPRAA